METAMRTALLFATTLALAQGGMLAALNLSD
jgi:hypothetical protein